MKVPCLKKISLRKPRWWCKCEALPHVHTAPPLRVSDRTWTLESDTPAPESGLCPSHLGNPGKLLNLCVTCMNYITLKSIESSPIQLGTAGTSDFGSLCELMKWPMRKTRKAYYVQFSGRCWVNARWGASWMRQPRLGTQESDFLRMSSWANTRKTSHRQRRMWVEICVPASCHGTFSTHVSVSG